ncbi:MAG: PfkB family carbohydrate kinase, partial [Candidatus Aminicenantes bacterium]|nr:PfkB family carbohydrate kinase [Candidatus Aminicenantes bacterium]
MTPKEKPQGLVKMEGRRLKRLVRLFRGRKVLVLGDFMLDKYIWGDVSRISPEAPVPVVEVKRDSSHLGGAGNVCHNLDALGGAALAVGVVGDDEAGRWIRRHVSDGRGLITDRGRPTTVKTRIIAHHQQVVRVDLEKRRPVSTEDEARILKFVAAENVRGLVLSDYHKGLLTPSLLERVLPMAKARKIVVCVDPKIDNFPYYSPVTLATPNHHEAERIVRHECRTDAQAERAGEEILRMIAARYLILKRGEHGMSVFERGRKPVHIPTIAKEVFDVTGAGDTVVAT